MAVTFKEGAIHITDLGVTLRTLMAVAADNQIPGKRVYNIAYTDGVVIGSVRIKQTGTNGKRKDPKL